MTDIITVAQATEVADQLVALAEQLSDFRFKNFADLSTEDSKDLRLKVSSIRRQASDITASIIGQKIQNLQDNLKEIAKAINEAEKALDQIKQTRKALDIATAIIRLGAAIITLNPVAILGAASDLITIS
jgi:CII-binding regulator of phage lambda lysogenization HflD